jgi:prevent-host-death family protein
MNWEVNMDPIVINATDLRIRVREIMERVKYKGDQFLVQTFGQPSAIIISVDEYYQMKALAQKGQDCHSSEKNGSE